MKHPFLQRHADHLAALALFATALTVYLRTLCPSLYWGDCGELATVAATLGIPHPTGYPLYCLLGKLWTLLLPVGNIVWRLNVLSAVFGALAATSLFGAARATGLPRSLALTAGGLLAFSFTFWQQCLITETYTLAAFWTCTLLFLAARWRARGCRGRDLRLLTAAYGLALTCHQTNTLFLPGFLAFVLWSAPHLRRLRERPVRAEWAKTLGLGLLPLLAYLYLPIRARMHPVYNWGDVETPFAFFYHVTGRAYSDAMFHGTLRNVWGQLKVYAGDLRSEFSWPVVAVAAFGLARLWGTRGERPLAFLLTWIFAADVTFVVNYGIYNGYIYYIPSYVVLSLWAAWGAGGLWQALIPSLETAKRPAFATFAALAALSLIPMQAWTHRSVSLRGNWTCYDYGRNLLASVPPHGLLIEGADDTAAASVTYLQDVEGLRPDVTLIRRGALGAIYDPRYHEWANFWALTMLEQSYPRIRELYPPQGISIPQALSQDPMRRIIRDAIAHGTPVCVLAPAGAPKWFTLTPEFVGDDGKVVGFGTYLGSHYDLSTVGLVSRVYPRGGRPAPAALSAETERVWRSYSLRGVFGGKLQDDRYLTMVALAYGNGGLARAQAAYGQGDYTTAEAAYRDVLTLFTCDAAVQGIARCRQARQVAAAPMPLSESEQGSLL